MTNYNGKEVLNGLLFIKSMMSVENVERQAIALRKLANKAGVDCNHALLDDSYSKSIDRDAIADVFDTLIVRDIRKKYKIRNTQLMDRIVDFLMDNVSNLSSARNITNTLGSMHEKIHHTTVGNYMQYLCNAFAFYKVRRYDIKGKKYLSSNDKYYLSDHTFRYAKLGTKNMDYGRILENIVAVELLRRGYEVYVGILYKKEIDFVAVKRSEKIYIQASDNISDEKTFEREVAPLLQIKDAYPKYVIARTRKIKVKRESINSFKFK